MKNVSTQTEPIEAFILDIHTDTPYPGKYDTVAQLTTVVDMGQRLNGLEKRSNNRILRGILKEHPEFQELVKKHKFGTGQATWATDLNTLFILRRLWLQKIPEIPEVLNILPPTGSFETLNTNDFQDLKISKKKKVKVEENIAAPLTTTKTKTKEERKAYLALKEKEYQEQKKKKTIDRNTILVNPVLMGTSANSKQRKISLTKNAWGQNYVI